VGHSAFLLQVKFWCSVVESRDIYIDYIGIECIAQAIAEGYIMH